MGACFEVGKKYYSRHDPDRYLIIDYRTPTNKVDVRGLMLTRETIHVDENGDEYFEITDPFKGVFRYSAKDIW